jgi:hypothetical protein
MGIDTQAENGIEATSEALNSIETKEILWYRIRQQTPRMRAKKHSHGRLQTIIFIFKDD